MVKCPNCGSENLDYSYYCGSCSRELTRADSGWKGMPAQAPPPAAGNRFCPSCGRTIQFDANVCPYCGHDFRWSTQRPAGSEPISGTMRVLLYLLSAFVPIAGIIVGVIFILKPEPDYKHVGKMCIIISLVIGVILPIAAAIAIFAAFMAI